MTFHPVRAGATSLTTTYDYDETGHATVVTGPAVNVESGCGAAVLAHPVTMTGYDTFGAAVEQTDANGRRVVVGYDAEGRAVSTTLPAYTAPGSSTPIVATATTTYDQLGRVSTSTDPLGHQVSSGAAYGAGSYGMECALGAEYTASGFATSVASGAAFGAASGAAVGGVIGAASRGKGEGGGCRRNSFKPSTQVLMADGTTKAIRDVDIGDEGISTDPAAETTSAEPVTALHLNDDAQFADVQLALHDGTVGTVHPTSDHLF